MLPYRCLRYTDPPKRRGCALEKYNRLIGESRALHKFQVASAVPRSRQDTRVTVEVHHFFSFKVPRIWELKTSLRQELILEKNKTDTRVQHISDEA